MKISEVAIVALEDASDKDVLPYGQVLGREKGEPFETLEFLKYYSKNADLGPDNEKVDGGLLVCNRNARRIRYLERHPQTSEIFLPVQGECVFLMAPSDNSTNKPDVSRLRAFYLNSRVGIALHKGTWHWPPIPLGNELKLVLFRKGALTEKMEVQQLKDLNIDEIKLVM